MLNTPGIKLLPAILEKLEYRQAMPAQHYWKTAHEDLRGNYK